MFDSQFMLRAYLLVLKADGGAGGGGGGWNGMNRKSREAHPCSIHQQTRELISTQKMLSAN